ncbi:hypothetical protein [Streptomyces sp. AcE210]|uniref:hypothetical protein n=1 Tax=Streptomyces sp. AcE210 TaxID=2292703 RepID=UPI0010592134|nr:hypothetical protein [Streptomyces sp. AcE210]
MTIWRSAAAVSKIAHAEGHTFADGARVAAATETHRADAAVRRREQLTDEALDAPSGKSPRPPAPSPHAMPATMPPPPAP